jgi:hypothetical protein
VETLVVEITGAGLAATAEALLLAQADATRMANMTVMLNIDQIHFFIYYTSIFGYIIKPDYLAKY